jgi:epoxyqueuosine reductase
MQFDARIDPVNEPGIASRLKDWALDEGFDRAGVARLRRSAHGPALADWLARGDHAEMAYLERRFETRVDPGTLFEGAASALCVAMQYHPLSGTGDPEGDLWPRVARYARGKDYHQVMENRLERLASRIEQAYPGTRTKVYVDTGPVLERELAARAGLGAIGKNTNLLDPEIGSWFLLGEIISSMHLEDDAIASDLCGTCTLCLEACPTGALPRAYRLDSRRCISYWTIEHRGAVPRRIRPLLGEWVFGCDICQEVCPVNTEVQAADHPEFELDTERAALDLAGLLSLARDQYVQVFRGSPMKRAKLEGLQRNAAVAMGNSKSKRYLSALSDALKRGGCLVKAHAAWALGQIGGTRARTALEDARREETEEAILAEIDAALAEVLD